MEDPSEDEPSEYSGEFAPTLVERALERSGSSESESEASKPIIDGETGEIITDGGKENEEEEIQEDDGTGESDFEQKSVDALLSDIDQTLKHYRGEEYSYGIRKTTMSSLMLDDVMEEGSRDIGSGSELVGNWLRRFSDDYTGIGLNTYWQNKDFGALVNNYVETVTENFDRAIDKLRSYTDELGLTGEGHFGMEMYSLRDRIDESEEMIGEEKADEKREEIDGLVEHKMQNIYRAYDDMSLSMEHLTRFAGFLKENEIPIPRMTETREVIDEGLEYMAEETSELIEKYRNDTASAKGFNDAIISTMEEAYGKDDEILDDGYGLMEEDENPLETLNKWIDGRAG